MARSNLISKVTRIETELFTNNKTETNTSYQLAEDDNGLVIYMDNASTITVTLPSGLTTGFNCTVVKQGAGNVTFSAGAGATIQSNITTLVLQYEAGTVYHKGSDTFNIFG